MIKLADNICGACKVGAPLVTPGELLVLLPEVSEWRLLKVDGEGRLQRTFEFADFSEALIFTNKVGEIAEVEGHHPEILTCYGSVTVSWWTHKIGGLHKNDFIMAARTDRLT